MMKVHGEYFLVSLEQATDVELHAHLFTLDLAKDIVNIATDIGTFGFSNQYSIKEGRARLEYEKFLLEQSGNPQFDFENKEAKEQGFDDFLEMKRAELRSVIILLLSLMALGGDWDEDGKKDIRQSWMGRKMDNVLNRVYRETAVFWDPTEMTGPRASGIPLMSLGQQLVRFTSNSMDEMRDTLFMENSSRDRTPPGYYAWKFIPGISGLVQIAEIYPQDKYKQY